MLLKEWDVYLLLIKIEAISLWYIYLLGFSFCFILSMWCFILIPKDVFAFAIFWCLKKKSHLYATLVSDVCLICDRNVQFRDCRQNLTFEVLQAAFYPRRAFYFFFWKVHVEYVSLSSCFLRKLKFSSQHIRANLYYIFFFNSIFIYCSYFIFFFCKWIFEIVLNYFAFFFLL